ncbi:hypothetical protein [Enterococcus sp. AZ196]|uniref:hypothetical protein n=1 Tax=Enterococcus sp. AZ196 TaxID=2774659 RepID=UPI003D2D0D79
MNAQQKKNGWFFNKNIIDEINSVPEEDILFEEEPNTLPEKYSKKQLDEIAELKRLNSEKDDLLNKLTKESTLENQRLMKENEKYKQALIRTGEEKAENRRQVQDLEAEVRRNRQEIQSLQDNKESRYLKEQLEEAEKKVSSLQTSLKSYQTLENELQEAKQQIHKFTRDQKDADLQYHEAIQKIEREMESVVNELQEKEEQVAQLDQLIVHKDQLILEKEELVQQLIEEQKRKDSVIESELISQLQHQIAKLENENEALKQEATHSQHEIGEVLISARRQANRMVEKAKLDAQRIVKDSEVELQTIYDRAKEISCEVDESRQTIMSIYEELKSRVDQLAQSNLPDIEEFKGRYEYPKVSVISRKEYK